MKNIMKKRVSRDSEIGNTLPEVMVAICIMGILVVGSIVILSIVSGSLKDAYAASALKAEHETLELMIFRDAEEAAKIEAFGVENIGNVGAYSQVENTFGKTEKASKELDYSTFVRVSDLSGELDTIISYKGSTHQFDKSEDGFVTVSYMELDSKDR